MAIPPGVGWISWRAVSSKPQMETESLDEQHQLNLRTIEDHKGYLFAELEVPGISRSLDSFEEAREAIPAYDQLWQIINNKRKDQLLILVTRDRSRLGRTVALIESVARACNMAGIAIYTRNMPPLTVDPKEQQGQMNLLYGMFGSVESQIEVERLVTRRSSGMAGRTRKGLHPGKLPFWLKKTYKADGSYIYESIIEMVPVALKFVEQYLNGLPLREIARNINDAGYRHATGRHWKFSDMKRWPDLAWRMAGYVEFNVNSDKESIFQKSPLLPAIIDEETAEAMVVESKHRLVHRRSRSATRFSFACVCGYCGDYLISSGPRRYACRNRCVGSHISEIRLTKAVYEQFEYLSTDVNKERLLALLVSPESNLSDDVAEVEKQIEGIRKQQERLLFAYTSGAVELDQYQAANEDFKRRILAMQGKLRDLERQQQEQRTEDDVLEMIENIATIGYELMAPDTDNAEVNQWLRKYFQFVAKGNHVVDNSRCTLPSIYCARPPHQTDRDQPAPHLRLRPNQRHE